MKPLDVRIVYGSSERVLRGFVDGGVQFDAIVTDPPAGIAFAGKKWDEDKGGRDQWVSWLTEIMRLGFACLKPGGHAVVWALPRTAHWTAWAIESAGFEIRDVVMHLFGTGMPKGQNVGKAFDRRAGAERPVLGRSNRRISLTGVGNGLAGTSAFSAYAGMGAWKTAPVTDEARRWEGWNTSTKPAYEPWIVARKPLEGTLLQNLEKYGVGALNVEGCRIEDERWPTNVTLQDEGQESRFHYVAKVSSFERHSGCGHLGWDADGRPVPLERAILKGNIHPTVKPISLMQWLLRLVTPPGGRILDPFAGSGTTGVAAVREGMHFLGIEAELSHVLIANARVLHARMDP